MEFFNILPLISFIIIAIAIISRILYLRSKGVLVTSKKTETPAYQLLVYPVFGLLLLLWMLQLIKIAFHLPLNILPSWLQERVILSGFLSITGFIIIIISLALLFLSLIHFKESLRFGLDSNNQGKLITSGVFAISRNPFFSSVNLYFTGLACLWPSLFFILMAVLSIFSIHLFILKEEKFLKKYYDDDYMNYANNVRRYL